MFGYMEEFTVHYTMLLKYTNFTATDQSISPSYEFTYQHPNDSHLRKLREQYQLNEVAGTGDEVSQIINLMKWVDQRLIHGNEPPPKLVHALSVLEMTEHADMKVNCYVIATVLTEVYLSLGFPARAKNLFWFLCPCDSQFHYEATNQKKEFCALVPEHYYPLELTAESAYRTSVHVTSENAIFWRAPGV
ncbi:hypothetical protein [Paenibacillus gallinarum]|uniref:Transglutaminase n=1 Tax=Paenibacillus gallinarum TaxID=2762232 RepID=A0ABR8T143_9BACL|nr:hypothetical protein [Paenibacillus gallinarum]MBD7969345.1 hypothetical protein [Paenibacillus gallinarum]